MFNNIPKSNYISSLSGNLNNAPTPSAMPTTGLSAPSLGNSIASVKPAVPASNAGATSTQPVTTSPARSAYTSNLGSSGSSADSSGNFTTPSGAVVNNSTGATVSGPTTSSGATNYDAAYQAYIQSLQPSTDVTAATTNLNNLTLQSKKDQADAFYRNGGTTGSASEESNKINRDESFGIDAATNSLNALTGQQTATTNADKARLDYEGSLQDQSKPFAVGNDTYAFDPSSGQYKITSSTPQKLDTSVVDVGGNKVLVNNQTGATIKNLGSSTDTSGTSTGGAYVAGSNPIADSWVQNINSGKAKLSDLTGNPSLKNLVAQGIASTGSSSNDILTTTTQSLQELNDLVANNQGFSGAVGAKGLSSLFGLKSTPIAGTAAANFDAKLNQVKNDVILPNLTLLHGLGRITDREFQSLSSAITSLSTNLSESDFKTELKNVTDTINSKIASSHSNSSGGTPITAPDGTQVIITD